MNYPDNFNAAAHDARYGDQTEPHLPADAYAAAALGELAKRMGWVEVVDDALADAIHNEYFWGRDEAIKEIGWDALKDFCRADTAKLLDAVAKSIARNTGPSAIERRIAADKAAIAAQVTA
jgi:hypothetical protein